MLRIGDPEAADASRAGGEELALVDEVRREEHDEQYLRCFPGLEVHRPDPHPEPRSVDLRTDPWERRQQQRGDAEQQERVLVALERAHVAHDDQGEHERGDADGRPHRLHAREIPVESRDGEVPDAVEQERDRQQRRIGAGREPSDRHVRDHVEAEHREQEHPEVGGDVRLVGEEQQHVAGRGHHDREERRVRARDCGADGPW